MCDPLRDKRELGFLYDWMRIARKPNQTLRQDIKLLFELISIPVTESQLRVIQKEINPEGKKAELTKEDLLSCFVVQEEQRKPKEKQLTRAFKYISGEQDDISFQQLKKHFLDEEVDIVTTEMILKQLCEYENNEGRFDYKQFVSSIL